MSLAYHVRLGKKVVLKADKRKITTKPELLRREVDILKELNHPYIPRVYDFFAEGDTVYTVMDYIEGKPRSSVKRENGFHSHRSSHGRVSCWRHCHTFTVRPTGTAARICTQRYQTGEPDADQGRTYLPD